MTITQLNGSTATVSTNVKLAQQVLQELCMSTRPFLPTPEVAAITLVAGYISHVASEKIGCDNCVSLVQNLQGTLLWTDWSTTKTGLGDSILRSSSWESCMLLSVCKDYAVTYCKSLQKPLDEHLKHSATVVTNLPVRQCNQCDEGHRRIFAELICKKIHEAIAF